MPHSPEVLELSSALREVLASLMPTASLSETETGDGRPPLVVMVRGHAVDVFAIGNQQDYQPMYAAFKKHYLEKGEVWASKDICFVFCIPNGHEADESFCSGIEVDVYFCRKYVIKLKKDLPASLSRLPFLPLTPISGAPIRPPSAQTLLRQRSIKADLARSLVEQGTSAATILKTCLAGRHGPAQAIDERNIAAPSETESDQRKQATLESISITNFRAYRKQKDFKLGSAITVLYGPNGFGKTSFFDAVDFAVTGGVGRLEKSKGGLAKAGKHLDSKDEPTEVSLTFKRDGATQVITRNLASPNDATLNGRPTSRKAILTALTGGEAESADRVENLVALFRATHLFSQDRQELTGEVAANCALPANLVSRMLAFDDYVNGVKKAGEVLKLARQQLDLAKKQSEWARKLLTTDTQEITRLEYLVAANTSEEMLEANFVELEQAIFQAGFVMDDVDTRDTRALRAKLEAEAEGAIRYQATLERSRKQMAELLQLQKQVALLNAQGESKRLLVEQAEEAAAQAEQHLSAAASELSMRQSQGQEAKRMHDSYTWAVSMQPSHKLLTVECTTLSNRIANISEAMTQSREAREKAVAAQGQATAALRWAEDAFNAATENRTRLQSVEMFLELATLIAPQLAVAKVSEASAQRDVDTWRPLVNEASQAVLVQGLQVARVDQQLTTAKSEESKLKRLIGEIRSHVNGASCLLCGHDHGSQEALLVAIDRRTEQSAVAMQLSEALTAENAERHKLEIQLEERKGLLSQSIQLLTNARLKREELERQQAEVHKTFASVGLAPNDAVAAELAHLTGEALHEEARCLTTFRQAQQQQFGAEVSLSSALQRHSVSETELQSVSASFEEAKRQLNELLATARQAGINFDTSLDSLQAAQLQGESIVAQTSAMLESASAAFEERRTSHTAATAGVALAQSSHLEFIQALSESGAKVQALRAALSATGIGAGMTDEQLVQLMTDAAIRATVAHDLRDRAAQLEVAADASATSVAFQSIRERIQRTEQTAADANELIGTIQPWVKYFDGVSKLLSGQQSVATNHFTTEYGPRTAVIQRRLRPVYGFQDIKVVSEGSSIEIHVSRNGEELRPTDYFSQSQVQTLVLGLFLTACSSQTWSGFSSIMMDDPVTHFDDLNIYALLDLISGLQSSPEGDRQFVISTCDEKLLQLARQKFRHLGEAAKFYRFSAIGVDGPMVAELPA